MVRSAAKNFESVAVVVDPKDYNKIIKELKENKKIKKQILRELAVKAFKHSARYDCIISEYLCECEEKGRLPETLEESDKSTGFSVIFPLLSLIGIGLLLRRRIFIKKEV